jgi:hypothetical protein
MFIRGSLPQYYTGMSNYTNMPLAKALEGIRALADELELDMYCTEVIKLEWGLNFPFPQEIAVNRFISNILVYKGKRPAYHGYEGGGMMFLIDLNDFGIKIYNKSAQRQAEDVHGNVMRYELKVNRKPLLNRMGIYSLSDLFDNRCTDALQSKLLESINHLVFYDYSIKAADVPPRNKALLLEYNNSQAWSSLMHNNQELYRKKKKSFATQVTKVSGIDWNKLLYDKVSTESEKLISTEVFTPALRMA